MTSMYSGYLKSVDIYLIEENVWKESAPLNVARKYHSSCALGNHIFVFCGLLKDQGYLNSVESLNAQHALKVNAD